VAAVKQEAKAARRGASPRSLPPARTPMDPDAASRRHLGRGHRLGSLFDTTSSLALGDPVPHRIDAALVGDPTGQASTVDALQGVTRGSLVFRPYASVPVALQAIDQREVYAALDLTSQRPTLYLASAAGASVARVLERIATVDPTVRVVDTPRLARTTRTA
jgi:hypothetical protein